MQAFLPGQRPLSQLRHTPVGVQTHFCALHCTLQTLGLHHASRLQLAHFLGTSTSLWGRLFWLDNINVLHLAFLRACVWDDESGEWHSATQSRQQAAAQAHQSAARAGPAHTKTEEAQRQQQQHVTGGDHDSALVGCKRQREHSPHSPNAAGVGGCDGHTAEEPQQRAAEAWPALRVRAADAVWAALLAEGRDLMGEVLSMHPAIEEAVQHACETAGEDERCLGKLTARLLSLPPPLHLSALRYAMRDTSRELHFEMSGCERDNERGVRALRGVPEVSTIVARFHLVEGEPQAASTCEQLTALGNSVGALLRALQPLSGLQSLTLQGGAGWSAADLVSFGCELPDLSPLAALTQLQTLHMNAGELSIQPSAAVVTQLTNLSTLKLSNYGWPLGPGQGDQGSEAADVSSGHGELARSAAVCRMMRCDGADCAFPRLRVLVISPPRGMSALRMPAAPQLASLRVLHGCPSADAHFSMRICATISAARSTLTHLSLFAMLGQARDAVAAALAPGQELWADGAAGHTACTSAALATPALRSLDLCCPEGRPDDAGARALFENISALVELRDLSVSVRCEPELLPELTRSATQLSALSHLQLGAEGDYYTLTATLGAPVRICVELADEIDVWDALDCSGLASALVAWAAQRSSSATALELETTYFTSESAATFRASLAGMHSLTSVSVRVHEGVHTVVADVAAACCSLQGLTSLSCAADCWYPTYWPDMVMRGPPVQLTTLTGLQHLALQAVQCGTALEDSLRLALPAMQQLRQLDLRDVQECAAEGGHVGRLAGLLKCLPTMVTQLHLSAVPFDGPGAGASFAERLPALTRLTRLLLCDCNIGAANLGRIVLALSRLPWMPEVVMAGECLTALSKDASRQAFEPLFTRASYCLRCAGEQGHEQALEQVEERHSRTYRRAMAEGWTVISLQPW